MKLTHLTLAALGSAAFLAFTPAKAQIIITEVDAAGSGTSSTTAYGEDWFELTNEGTTSISTAGDLMSDNHGLTKTPVAMSTLTLAPGQSAVYIEDDSNPFASDAALEAAFETTWFGSTSNAPANFLIGTYGGAATPGLGQSGDAVNIYNSSDTLLAGVSFGASTGTSGTFDNSVSKIDTTTGTGQTDAAVTTFSQVGVNGAFLASDGEIGSPGAVPEPSSYLLGLGAVGIFAVLRLRRMRQEKV